MAWSLYTHKTMALERSQRIELDLFVIKAMKQFDASHDIAHVFRVWKNAERIASSAQFSRYFGMQDDAASKLTSAMLWSILEFSAKLHDVLDHKYKEHTSAQDLDTFLCKYSTASYVKYVIENVSFSKQDKGRVVKHPQSCMNVIRDIVADADRIDALGTQGLERCRQFIRANPQYAGKGNVDELVVKHCHDKLLRLYGEKGFIVTEEGRELAAPLHDEIVAFVASVTSEHKASTSHDTTKKRKTAEPSKEGLAEHAAAIAKATRVLEQFNPEDRYIIGPMHAQRLWEHSDGSGTFMVCQDTFASCWACGVEYRWRIVDATAKEPEIYQCTDCLARWIPLDGVSVWKAQLCESI